MKVASVKLQNFKRFTDLIIRDIPNTAKLVVVVGPNGCGKSSLFDAFFLWYRSKAGFGINNDQLYYRKSDAQPFGWQESVSISLHGSEQIPKRGSLYIRTAYRNDPDFSISGFNRPQIPSETIRFNRVIENDQTVSQNYERLVYDTMAAVYDKVNDAKSVQALREELIGKVRTSMEQVFGNLLLNSITDPLGSGAFFFEKGDVKSYHYKNLSGGEKAAFDLILDLHIKKKFYTDAIFCIDEIETHLHTRVQGALLKEMVNIIPEQSQLWVTTHSIGVLRAAQELAATNPASVCVIDFDGVDPDIPRELLPSNLGRVSWEKLLSIALDDLSQRIAPKKVIVCEGSSLGNRRKDFDAEIYNRILGAHYPDILFVSGGSSTQVASTGVSVKDTLSRILPSAKVWSLVDRDDKSENEIMELEKQGVITLSQRNLESFLFADDVIEALLIREQKQNLLDKANEIKRVAITNSISRGNPADDMKSAAGEIYIGLKKLLELKHPGNNSDAFMRDTLAPVIMPTLPTYKALKETIVDNLK